MLKMHIFSLKLILICMLFGCESKKILKKENEKSDQMDYSKDLIQANSELIAKVPKLGKKLIKNKSKISKTDNEEFTFETVENSLESLENKPKTNPYTEYILGLLYKKRKNVGDVPLHPLVSINPKQNSKEDILNESDVNTSSSDTDDSDTEEFSKPLELDGTIESISTPGQKSKHGIKNVNTNFDIYSDYSEIRSSSESNEYKTTQLIHTTEVMALLDANDLTRVGKIHDTSIDESIKFKAKHKKKSVVKDSKSDDNKKGISIENAKSSNCKNKNIDINNCDKKKQNKEKNKDNNKSDLSGRSDHLLTKETIGKGNNKETKYSYYEDDNKYENNNASRNKKPTYIKNDINANLEEVKPGHYMGNGIDVNLKRIQLINTRNKNRNNKNIPKKYYEKLLNKQSERKYGSGHQPGDDLYVPEVLSDSDELNGFPEPARFGRPPAGGIGTIGGIKNVMKNGIMNNEWNEYPHKNKLSIKQPKNTQHSNSYENFDYVPPSTSTTSENDSDNLGPSPPKVINKYDYKNKMSKKKNGQKTRMCILNSRQEYCTGKSAEAMTRRDNLVRKRPRGSSGQISNSVEQDN